MALEPDYGETLLSHEESEALTPEARSLLGEYDTTRNPSALAEFIPVVNLEEAE